MQSSKTGNIYMNELYLKSNDIDFDDFLNSNEKYIVKRISEMTNLEVALYNSDKKLLDSNFSNNIPNNQKILDYAFDDKISYFSNDNYIEYASPVFILSKPASVICFRYYLDKEIKLYTDMRNMFIFFGFIITVCGFFISYLYFNKISKSIVILNKNANKVKNQYYDLEQLDRNDELGELSDSILSMSKTINSNIKARKKEENRLKLAIKKLKVLEKEQRVFIGNITHEFKTPLTVIQSYVDLMKIYDDDQIMLKEGLIIIENENKRLFDMVSKILKLSEIEKYEFEFDYININIANIIKDVKSIMSIKAKKFNVSLDFKLKDEFVVIDEDSIKQVFINLIDNAIKYNKDNGYVKIYLKREDGFLNIYIENTGKKIPFELKDKIFDAFYRVDKNRSKEYGGFGLGLNFVKLILEKHNSHIELIDDRNTKFLIKISLNQS